MQVLKTFLSLPICQLWCCVLLYAFTSPVTAQGNCRLPNSWRGKWFQSGVQQPIHITRQSMDTKGSCYDMSGDKFLFVESANNNCHRCVVINERHPNVLQYKESPYCEEGKSSLESLCSDIAGDAPLYSLYRLDAPPQPCPFTNGPFTFTYNRGYGVCKSPVSHMDTCTLDSRLLLRYEACPDVKSESSAEELECVGEWREGSHWYLIGKIHHHLSPSFEDTYRCFLYDQIKGQGPHGAVLGYRVAMSGDATCLGISSPTEGARTLTFTKAEPKVAKCKFPSWLSAHKWHTLDGKLAIKMTVRNTTMTMEDESARGRNVSVPNYGPSHLLGSGGKSYAVPGSSLTCQNIKEFSDRHVAIKAQRLVGCKRETMCVHVYKRDSHVVEMQMRAVASSEEFSCTDSNALDAKEHSFVTLISVDSTHRKCPYLGKYSASGVSPEGRVIRESCGPNTKMGPAQGIGQGIMGGQLALQQQQAFNQQQQQQAQGPSFQTLVVGCGDRATMEFHSHCPNQEQSTAFLCHGSWEENGQGFLIASPLSRSSTTARRYCFIYTTAPEGNIRMSSSSESCRRNPGAPDDPWAFILTVQGQCAEAVTGGSESKAVSVMSSLIPLVLFLWFLVNSSAIPLHKNALRR